jgi:hypothetical protein
MNDLTISKLIGQVQVILPNFSDAAACLPVYPQVVAVGKSFGTDLTDESFQAKMGIHMTSQVSSLGEAKSTIGSWAYERLFLIV